MRHSLLDLALLLSGVLADPFQAPLQQDIIAPSYTVKTCMPGDTLTACDGQPGSNDIHRGVTDDPRKVHGKNYDYVIAGGGLTGLTLAAKLVEKKFTVLVIESGFYAWEYGPKIDDLNTYGQVFGSSVDHAYETKPQLVGNDGDVGLDKDIKIIRSGNGLGGSTLINGGTWTRPHKVQIDSWNSTFGNTGWTWEALKPKMDEIEIPRDPATDKITPGSLHHFDPNCHNKDPSKGKVKVGARDRKYGWSPLIKALMDTVQKTYNSVTNRKDLCCGDPTGVSMFLNTLTNEQVRTDAARSWLKPILENSTLTPYITVLTGQLVGKVHLDAIKPSTGKAKWQAKGVEFGIHNKTEWKWDVWANKEVLLAAGSTISPLILQWSGIGPKAWLDNARIQQKLELPVGYNLQDQTTTSVVTNPKDGGKGQGQAAYFATFAEVLGKNATYFESILKDDKQLESMAKQTVKGGGFPDTVNLLRQYKNYQEWLLKDKVSYAELFLDTDNSTHFDLWNLIPFTRGYVKALDSDPYLRSFEYNPRYFENKLDLYGQAAATRLARQLTNTYDMKPLADKEMVPGRYVPQDATLDEWAYYVKQNYRANYHGVGTCSMMKQEYGGVVNPEAKVYGVQGLRVVDGSIPPTQVSSHVMTVFYAMAVKIAESVIADAPKPKEYIHC
ncbi:glucose oxidase [Aspergillus nomiae NRRL 13137]|uniref:glucose oxidase n=1 Tax=Aspergillus nomiae NRRL (strain ATCC 15546 / NRRL 13137 / CBS 260.88 / M93) TaxID=1509407 RepID=A0A0L1IU78_ASPN3|nr:glucose oxidase [Aspergillus nomiae NRRL 13137]KNG82965.1 glucose oxidase [Aspergillus nomiae NRRL 13137]